MTEQENFCDICCSCKVAPPEHPNDTVCECRGLQPYSLSTYPGEYQMSKSHPGNKGDQFYKRAEVDAMLDGLNLHIKEAERSLPEPMDSKPEHGVGIQKLTFRMASNAIVNKLHLATALIHHPSFPTPQFNDCMSEAIELAESIVHHACSGNKPGSYESNGLLLQATVADDLAEFRAMPPETRKLIHRLVNAVIDSGQPFEFQA